MTNHEKLRENYEDASFALLMDEVAQREGQQALELNRQLQSDPTITVPEDIQQHCKQTIQTAFTTNQPQKKGKKLGKVLKNLAVAAVVGALMFTTAFAASEKFRSAVMTAFIEVLEQSTDITFGESQSPNQKLEYQFNIALEWMPEGYRLNGGRLREEGTSDTVYYINDVNSEIFIDITPYDPGMTYSYDTEFCDQKSVTVQGWPATLYTKTEEGLKLTYGEDSPIWSARTVVWMDDDREVIMFVDANNVTEEEVLRLAEGVHWGG